jgi:Fic family protein
MKFPPYYTRSEKINKLIYEIDVLKGAYALHPMTKTQELELQRKSVLKSSLFSARIEGNPLTLSDLKFSKVEESPQRHTHEVANIANALETILKDKEVPIGLDSLRKVHAIILDGLSNEASHVRTDESAIYNQAGIAVYLAPTPRIILTLLDGWYVYCNSSLDPVPIKAAMAHIWFEKIHPFLDGNGRVGRIITNLILVKGGYGFGGIVPFEEYLDNHRDEYYEAIAIDRPDVTEFVVFFLEAFLAQGRKALAEAAEPLVDPFPNLLPRRAEILSIVKEHKLVSFNFIARRFQAIPERTLHYDLAQMVKEGWIKKLGSTRGVVYVPGIKMT